MIDIIKHMRRYCQEAHKLRAISPGNYQLLKLMGHFPIWYRDLVGNSNSLKDEKPWITYGAFSFLDRVITNDMRVFEYGSGGSTIYFASHAKWGASVEHDKEWANRVRSTIGRKHQNWKVELMEPVPDLNKTNNPSELDSYRSASPTYRNYSFEEYVREIDKFPDGYFDIVFIDGRARLDCVVHAKTKISMGGLIVLDNSERSQYSKVHHILCNESWHVREFYGPGPYNDYFWSTTIWQRVA